MITLNWFAILALSAAAFAGGALWFGPFFGSLWMKIHGMENTSKAQMEKMREGMWYLMLGEFVSLFLMMMGLDFLTQVLPAFSGLHVGFMMWLGFVLPTCISAVIWGKDAKKWMIAKISLSAAYRLIVLLGAGYAFGIW